MEKEFKTTAEKQDIQINKVGTDLLVHTFVAWFLRRPLKLSIYKPSIIFSYTKS